MGAFRQLALQPKGRRIKACQCWTVSTGGCGKETISYDHDHNGGCPRPCVHQECVLANHLPSASSNLTTTQGPAHACINTCPRESQDGRARPVCQGLPCQTPAELVPCWTCMHLLSFTGAPCAQRCLRSELTSKVCVLPRRVNTPETGVKQHSSLSPTLPLFPLSAKCVTCQMFMQLPSPTCMLSCTFRASSPARCDAHVVL